MKYWFVKPVPARKARQMKVSTTKQPALLPLDQVAAMIKISTSTVGELPVAVEVLKRATEHVSRQEAIETP